MSTPFDRVKDFAIGRLASGGIDNVTTSIPLLAGNGANFLSFPGNPYNCVIWNETDYASPDDDPNKEWVRVTGLSVDTLTATRGQQGTSAVAHNTAGKSYAIALDYSTKMSNDITGAINTLETQQKQILYPHTFASATAGGGTGTLANPWSGQAILDAIASLTAGTPMLIVLEGFFRVGTGDGNSITLPSNVGLLGLGELCGLVAASGAAGDITLLQNTDSTNGNTDINLANFKIIGNGIDGTTGKNTIGLTFNRGARIQLQRVFFSTLRNAFQSNIVITPPVTDGAYPLSDLSFYNCNVDSCHFAWNINYVNGFTCIDAGVTNNDFNGLALQDCINFVVEGGNFDNNGNASNVADGIIILGCRNGEVHGASAKNNWRIGMTCDEYGPNGPVWEINAIAAGGTGYAVGNTLTISGGTGATVRVATVSAGAVTSVDTLVQGSGYGATPQNGTTVGTTGGTGTGCTLTIKAGYHLQCRRIKFVNCHSQDNRGISNNSAGFWFENSVGCEWLGCTAVNNYYAGFVQNGISTGGPNAFGKISSLLASHLVSSTSLFTKSKVERGDWVVRVDNNALTFVRTVNSDTDLTLDDDIFAGASAGVTEFKISPKYLLTRIIGCHAINNGDWVTQPASSDLLSSNYGWGFYIASSGCTIEGCTAFRNTESGFVVGRGLDASGGALGTFFNLGALRNQIATCISAENGASGYQLWMNHCSVQNSKAMNNGRITGFTDRFGIEITNDAGVNISDLQLISNECWDDQPTKTQTYGIRITRNSGATGKISNVLMSGNIALKSKHVTDGIVIDSAAYDGTLPLNSFGNVGLTAGETIRPENNSTTAWQWQQANGTVILNIDSTNNRVGVKTNAPACDFDVNGVVGIVPDTVGNQGAKLRLRASNDANWGFSFTNATGAGSDEYHGRFHLSSAANGVKRQYQICDTTNGGATIVVRGAINMDTGYMAMGHATPTAFCHPAASVAAAASLRIPAGVAPTSPNDGDIWNDSTQKAYIAYLSGQKLGLSGLLFANTSGSTNISNTITETNFSVSYTLPANVLTVSKVIKIRAWGTYSTGISPGILTLRVKIGSIALVASASVTLTASVISLPWFIECEFITRSIGTSASIFPAGFWSIQTTPNGTVIESPYCPTASSTINTTVTQNLAISMQETVASTQNIIVLSQMIVEMLN